jgi:CO dehydrogenase nickel-insertion accessory protein CooC1
MYSFKQPLIFGFFVKGHRGLGMKISVCGKGGSGKSTLVCLLAKQAEARGQKVLVVDSDESNSGLFRMLGFPQPPTPLMVLVGGKRKLKEKMRRPNVLAGSRITTEDIPCQYVIRRNGIGFVSIGKNLQSLEGCACPMGVLSREFLSKLRLNENEIAIVDMEAGPKSLMQILGAGPLKAVRHFLLQELSWIICWQNAKNQTLRSLCV